MRGTTLQRSARGLGHAQPRSSHPLAAPTRAVFVAAATAGYGGDEPVAVAPPPPPSLPRRSLLLAVSLASSAALTAARPPQAAADAATAASSSSSASSFLPDVPAAPLPKAYVETTRRLVTTLRSSITTETAGAEEFEVRRAAEPAKEAVKEWVGVYGVTTRRGGAAAASGPAAAVEGTASHAAVQAALTTLGRFYGSKGQRARLDGATAEAVLASLAAAEDALPPEEPKVGLKERLLGKKG